MEASGEPCNRISNRQSIAKIAKELEQSFMTELLDKKLHDDRSDKVGVLQVNRRLRSQKHFAHAARGLKLSVSKPMDVRRVWGFAPIGSMHPLLVNRNAFREPAGHSVVGQIQRDDVAVFVPKYRFPIVIDLERRGRVGGDHLAKANSEEPLSTRESKRTDCEIPLFGKQFHDDRLFEFHWILLDQILSGLLKDLGDFCTKDFRLGCLHSNHEPGDFDRCVLIELLFEDL